MNFRHHAIIGIASVAMASNSFGIDANYHLEVMPSGTPSEHTIQEPNAQGRSVHPETSTAVHPALSALWAWMIEHSPYETPATWPKIEFRSATSFSTDICQSDAHHCTVGGHYRDGSGTIILRADPGDLDDVRIRALLIHELTHYLQDQSGHWQEKSCRNWMSREREAYDVQRRFLVDNNGNPFGIGTPPLDEALCAAVIN